MYMRLPVNCSKASETEATSTRRNSEIKAPSVCGEPATDCARKNRAPHNTPDKMPMNTIDSVIRWDFTKPRNLFILSSSMYICSRTLTLFFVGWKYNPVIAKENGNENN